jgi:hypothetical protein
MVPPALPGQEILLSAGLTSREIRVSADYAGDEIDQVLAALQEGFKSEIVFQKSVTRLAYRDLFEQRFVIESGDERLSIGGEEAFLPAFFRLSGFRLASIRDIDVRDYYVLGRIRVQPVRLVSPLNIVTLLFRRTVTTTPWQAVDILAQGIER